jgi:tRNA modification GTPase
MYRRDTIVARATAAGRAAVAIVRLSGPEARDIAGRMLRGERSFDQIPARSLVRFVAVDPATASVLDDVLAVAMPGPCSYTGEDIVEIHCHGSPAVTDALVRIALELGARAADAGEFTRRAYLNDRIDLVQAEAVAELIDAPVLAGAIAASSRLSGALSATLGELRARLILALAEVEAHIDFSEDDLPDETPRGIVESLEATLAEIRSLVGGFAVARREQRGYRVVLAGRPNVGKSSLMNAIVGFERVVVSDEPGTTRDAVGEVFELDGHALCVTDTAGFRKTDSLAERGAVEHSRRAVAAADILVRVFDSSAPFTLDDQVIAALRADGDALAVSVLNKKDRPTLITEVDVRALCADSAPVIWTSALMAGGVASLRDAILTAIQSLRGSAGGEGVGLGRERHRAALERTARSITCAVDHLRDDRRTELAAVELRRALHELASVTDAVEDDEVLDEIFSSFCIGK